MRTDRSSRYSRDRIDGTGAPAAADQTVLIQDRKIASIEPSSRFSPLLTAKIIDASGDTLIPGLVGMHEHLFFTAPSPSGTIFIEQPTSFPELYLASGVTTARTAGSMEPYADLNVKHAVDAGFRAGPKLELTGPYLEGSPPAFAQMHALSGPDEARAFIRYWHFLGFTSMKAYVGLTLEELRAAIEDSHKLGIKITEHLCSVSFTEAAAMGIDNLEHGPFGAPDSELYSKRKAGSCTSPEMIAAAKEIADHIDPEGPELQRTIRTLIARHVAITSTLAVFEGESRPSIMSQYRSRLRSVMSPLSWTYAVESRAFALTQDAEIQTIQQKEMKFEHAFVKAGGVLMAGATRLETGILSRA